MFCDHNRATRLVAMRDIMNTTMVERPPMRNHVLKMTNLLNELKLLGFEIDGETQVDIIL